MRKMITCILFVGLVALLCLNGYATEYSDPRDSRNIPQTILEKVEEENPEVVARYYRTWIDYACYEHENIDAVLAYAADNSWDLFVAKSETGLSFHALTASGEYHRAEFYETPRFSTYALQEFQSGEAIKSVSQDIAVESVYYISGENDYSGTAIYYRTNLGDYVYYSQAFVGALLFSAEAFFEYQRSIYSQALQENATDFLVGGNNYDSWDLSVYDYRSPNFNPNAPFPKTDTTSPYLWIGITAGVVVLTAIAAFFIIKAKRKASVLPEET